MTYEEFKDIVVARIKDYLPASYQDAAISIAPVLKNNNLRLDGLLIRRMLADGTNTESVAPNIYLNQFYEEYKDGRELEDILSYIARVRQSHEGPLDLDVAAITDWEQVKPKVLVKLINSAQNAEYLEGKPHKDIADLSAIYYIDLGTDSCGNMTTVITDALLSQYGVSVEELHQTAVQNMGSKARFCSMFEVLSELMPDNSPVDELPQSDGQMYILTNQSKVNGASMILCPQIMDEIGRQIGTSYFVLPSSINELILVKSENEFDVDALRTMVREVNSTQLAADEILSESVYLYDYDSHSLVVAA